jgi:hypothetical protein
MKKLFAIAGSALLIVVLAACSGGSSSAPSPDPTVTVTATPTPTVTVTAKPTPTKTSKPKPPAVSKETRFLNAVNGSGNYYAANNSNASILQVGQETCRLLDNGYTVNDVVAELEASVDQSDSEFVEFEALVIYHAVTILCPEYRYQLPN